jgi:ribosomal protein L37AE/L43A
MTANKRFKRQVRARSAKTGESYTAALRHLRADHEETAMPAQCSFCKKPAAADRRLVGGPGVFICQECVELCSNVLGSEIDPAIPTASQAHDESILAVLPKIAATAEEVERELATRVHQLRSHDVDWERIGAALGVTAEEASRRFEP